MGKILGIDQSLVASGVCILGDDGKHERLHLITPKKLRGVERLMYIRDALLPLIEGVDKVVMEGYGFGAAGSSRAVFDLGELGGLIKVLCHEKRKPLLIVSPSSLKAFATGKGNATKEDVTRAAEMRLGVRELDNNICDAYFLALFLFELKGQAPRIAEKGGADLLRKIRGEVGKKKRATPPGKAIAQSLSQVMREWGWTEKQVLKALGGDKSFSRSLFKGEAPKEEFSTLDPQKMRHEVRAALDLIAVFTSLDALMKSDRELIRGWLSRPHEDFGLSPGEVAASGGVNLAYVRQYLCSKQPQPKQGSPEGDRVA